MCLCCDVMCLCCDADFILHSVSFAWNMMLISICNLTVSKELWNRLLTQPYYCNMENIVSTVKKFYFNRSLFKI